VDSTLLVASGLLSHNLVAPALGITDDRAKVRLARAGVAGFGVLAGFLAVRSEGVFALVEDASAFGGAGILVTACFGLFGRVGGPAAALLCLVTSTVAFLALKLGGAPYPFLGSVAVALAAYGAGAVVEGWLGRSVVPEEPPLG
jgi:hypothetical protein